MQPKLPFPTSRLICQQFTWAANVSAASPIHFRRPGLDPRFGYLVCASDVRALLRRKAGPRVKPGVTVNWGWVSSNHNPVTRTALLANISLMRPLYILMTILFAGLLSPPSYAADCPPDCIGMSCCNQSDQLCRDMPAACHQSSMAAILGAAPATIIHPRALSAVSQPVPALRSIPAKPPAPPPRRQQAKLDSTYLINGEIS